jgi:predicted transcriptional regulator
MASTKTATFSIRLRPDTKRRLAKLAEASGRSSNFLIGDAVEAYIEDQERARAEIRAALNEADSGHYIPHEAMKAWLLSWGTDRDLPPPRCACGSIHDEDNLNGRSSGPGGLNGNSAIFETTSRSTSPTRLTSWPSGS